MSDLVVTDDPQLARRMRLFVNKAWGYGDANPDHYFLALNYRLTELQGAVALAQLDKLEWSVRQRRAMAATDPAIADLPGITPPHHAAGGGAQLLAVLRLGRRVRRQGRLARARRRPQGLRHRRCPPLYPEAGVPLRGAARSGLAATAAFRSPWRGRRRWITGRRNFPGTFRGLEQILVLPWNERFTEHVDFIADSVAASTRSPGVKQDGRSPCVSGWSAPVPSPSLLQGDRELR